MTQKREKEIANILGKDCLAIKNYGRCETCEKHVKAIQAHISKEYVRRDEVGIDRQKVFKIIEETLFLDGTVNKQRIAGKFRTATKIASSKDVLTFNKGQQCN